MAEDKKINTEAELWSKAYDGLRSEKNGSKLLNPLRESLLKQESLRNKHVGSLRSAKGRSILLQFVSEQQKDMKVPNSQLVHLGEKAKGLIVSGVAASPPATVAVAGLFPAWDVGAVYPANGEILTTHSCIRRTPKKPQPKRPALTAPSISSRCA